MKKYLLLCLLSLVVNINAQALKEWNVGWGEENITNTEFPLGKSVEMLGADGTRFYVREKTGGITFLCSYDLETKKLIQSQKIEYNHKDKRMTLERLIITDARVWGLFHAYDNDENEKEFLYVSRLMDGKLEEPKELINYNYDESSDDRVTFFEKKGLLPDLSLQYGQSADKSKFFISYSTQYKEEEEENDKISIFTFNNTMEVIWMKEQELPYFDKELSLEEMVISNQGEVYLLAKKLNKRKRKLPDFDFVVFKINKESLEEFPVFINETNLPTLAKITLIEAESTSFVVAGLYNNAKIKGLVEGVYYCKGPMEGKEQYTEFASLFKFGEDLNKSAVKSVITNILNFPNGDIAIVSEQQYADEIERISIDGDSADPYTKYTSNDILVTRFSPKGKVRNIDIIKKQFYTKNKDYFYSNHSGAIGNKCVIAFNQFYEDAELENKGRSFLALGMSTIPPQARIVILSENGDKFANGILKLATEKLFFAPPLTAISDEFFLLGSIDNKFKNHAFGEFKFD